MEVFFFFFAKEDQLEKRGKKVEDLVEGRDFGWCKGVATKAQYTVSFADGSFDVDASEPHRFVVW